MMSHPSCELRAFCTKAAWLGVLLLPISCLAASSTTPAPSVKQPIPLEQIITKVRKTHGNVIIQNARLTEEDRRSVRALDFLDQDNIRHRMIIDAFTGKALELVPLKEPMLLEKALERIKTRHQTATILRSWLDQREGEKVRIVEFIDRKHKRWQTTLDAYTGGVVSEHMYESKPSGRLASLTQIIEKARETRKDMVIMRIRLAYRKGAQVREVFYRDGNSQRKRLVVHANTGEVIEDKPVAGFY